MRETMTRNWAELSEQEIAEAWTRVGYDLPAGLLEETLARGSKMIPRLGPMIAEEAWWNEKEPPQWMAPCHALLLIAAIRSSEAAPYVAEWLRRGFGEDWLTEEGHKVVFWMGPDCIEQIWGVAQDAGADVWGRLKALEGLCLLGIQHEGVREQIIRNCRGLAGRLIEKPDAEFSNEDGMVLTRLCESLADLHDEDSKDLIRRGYRLGRCDEWTASEKSLLDEYDQPFGHRLRLDWLDPLEHFRPERLARLKRLHLGIPEKPRLPMPTPSDEGVVPLRSTKVGRNDPCPCGSGRKYKKCCGAV